MYSLAYIKTEVSKQFPIFPCKANFSRNILQTCFECRTISVFISEQCDGCDVTKPNKSGTRSVGCTVVERFKKVSAVWITICSSAYLYHNFLSLKLTFGNFLSLLSIYIIVYVVFSN